LRNKKCRELRNIYPNIPSHYVHGVYQHAAERVSSLRRNKAGQYAEELFLTNYPANRGNMTYFNPAAIFKSAVVSIPGAYGIYVGIYIPAS
jgi:hypothetical protein